MNTNDTENEPTGLPAPIPAPARTIDLIPHLNWTEEPRFALPPDPAPKFAWRPGLILATAVVLAAAAASGATLALSHRHEAARLAASAAQTETLAKTVAALGARLDSMEQAKPRQEAADIRRALSDVKSASSKDLDAALARLSQRIDALDREQNAKVEKVDRSTDTKAAELTARLDKLEKKVATAPPPPPKPAQQVAGAKVAPPKFGPNVSMETTGSIRQGPQIDRPPVERPVLRGYVVLGARPDAALIADAWGERAVHIGDFLPGAGRVERIERQGPAWVVQTNAGVIPPAGSEPE